MITGYKLVSDNGSVKEFREISDSGFTTVITIRKYAFSVVTQVKGGHPIPTVLDRDTCMEVFAVQDAMIGGVK